MSSTWTGHPVTIILARAVAEASAQDRAALFLAAFGDAMPLEDTVDGRLWLAQVAAQTAHESAGFVRMVESLHYSTPDRLRRTWSSRFAALSDADLAPLLRNERALASAVYAGRLGNLSASDAFDFRGRGPTQLTGRANYAAAGRAIGVDLVAHPDLAARPEHAGQICAWFVRERVRPKVRDASATRAVRVAWNGGLNGLEDVRLRFDAARAALRAAGLL